MGTSVPKPNHAGAPHDLAFSSPTKGSSINGYPTLRGQAKDNILLKEVYLVFEKNSEEIKLNDSYNWNYELDAGSVANAVYGYPMGNNIYRVPFRIRAVDQAGNVALSPGFGTNPDNPGIGSYYLDVDLDGDSPVITNILSPGGENTQATPYLVTGSIKVQGTASDDDGLHHVEMALIALSGATESYRNLDGTQAAPGSFYTVAGLSLWNYVLNQNGELYALADFTGHSGDFKIMVRAVDTKINSIPDITGDPKTVYVRFDNTLPGVILLQPEEGTIQRDTFPLTFTAKDNNGIVQTRISYDNGSSYTNLNLNPGGNSPKKFACSASVNSKTVNGAAFAASSGSLYMRIQLKDDTGNVTEKSFKYLIDNIAPVNVTPPSTATMAAISNRMYTDSGASLAEILGVVNDTGTIRGIKKVEVYFERLGAIYRMKPDFPATSIASVPVTFSNGSFPYTIDDSYKIVIDKAENYIDATVSGGDNDGYQESLSMGTSGYTWGARFDSEKLSDGNVTVHYVAWDEANNATHFQVAGIIRNTPPTIASIVLGTDLNADGDALDNGERVKLTKLGSTWNGYTLKADDTQLGPERPYDLNDPIMTIRNSRFTFSAIVTGGNGTIQYQAFAPNGSTTLLNWTAIDNYSTTNFTPGGWVEDSINSLTIQARDSAYGTELATALVSFKVGVDNSDGTAPSVSLAPIGTMYDTPTIRQSLSYTSRIQQAVVPYAENLYWIDIDSNGIASRDEWLGHVELPADSHFNGLDADVSGTIILRGKTYDDQRIGRMTVAFNVDFDLNGTASDGVVELDTEIDLAVFSSGTLGVSPARAAAQTLMPIPSPSNCWVRTARSYQKNLVTLSILP